MSVSQEKLNEGRAVVNARPPGRGQRSHWPRRCFLYFISILADVKTWPFVAIPLMFYQLPT